MGGMIFYKIKPILSDHGFLVLRHCMIEAESLESLCDDGKTGESP
jgi:hypothetical protein